MQSAKELLFWIWLAEALGPANRSFRNLILRYETPFEIYRADAYELEGIEGLSNRALAALSDKNLEQATSILEACQRLGIGLLPFGDERYPKNLRHIKAPPVLLYYKGRLPDFDRRLCIGMVGTRKMSAYGLRHAYKIAYELTAAGAVTVSGMAAGIDGVSAGASLAAGGMTVAVLGCSVDLLYPQHHAKLKSKIEQNGLVLSEYPPGTKPNAYHFPTRNRIISGIAEGTVVIEAGLGSGSLITAKDAIEEGRDVFALPSNLGSRTSAGTNGLLRDGAYLVLSTDDILDPYKYVFAETLHPEKIATLGEKSEADLAFLDEIGVISWQPGDAAKGKTDEQEPPKKAAPKKAEKSTKKEPEVEPAPTVDQALLAGLSVEERKILDAMPDGKALPLDALLDLGLSYGEVLSAVTTLEILGFLTKLPGSQYRKTV